CWTSRRQIRRPVPRVPPTSRTGPSAVTGEQTLRTRVRLADLGRCAARDSEHSCADDAPADSGERSGGREDVDRHRAAPREHGQQRNARRGEPTPKRNATRGKIQDCLSPRTTRDEPGKETAGDRSGGKAPNRDGDQFACAKDR